MARVKGMEIRTLFKGHSPIADTPIAELAFQYLQHLLSPRTNSGNGRL
jgi:hypothetical protein